MNNLWLAVAAVEETITGHPWEDLVADRLFTPLGMRSATTNLGGLLKGPNVALPHVLVDGKPTPTRADYPDIGFVYTYGPAGGINANALDMAAYVIAHLNRGTYKGKALLKPETARWLHDPKTIVTFKGPANVQHGVAALGPMFYCQGWLRQLLSPTPLVWHNGGTPGSKAVVGFTPESDLGVVVLSNLENTGLPEALMYYLYGLYYGRPVQDYTGMFLADAKALAAPTSTPPATQAPARGLSAYAGSCENPYFGPLTVEPQDGALLIRVGQRQTLVRTKHWNGDTFAIALPGYGDRQYTDGFVSFQFGQGERATDLRFIRAFDDAADGRFTGTPSRE